MNKVNVTILTSKTDKKRGMFILPSEAGAVITAFKDNPLEGFTLIVQRKPKLVQLFSGTTLRMSTRTCLFKGEIASLEYAIEEWSDAGKIPGQIICTDFLEADLPSSLYDETTGMLKEYAEKLCKVAGDTGVECTLDGERIFRMRSYTDDMSCTDAIIAHDNGNEIRTVQASMKAANKNIPVNANFDNDEFKDAPLTNTEADALVVPAGNIDKTVKAKL